MEERGRATQERRDLGSLRQRQGQRETGKRQRGVRRGRKRDEKTKVSKVIKGIKKRKEMGKGDERGGKGKKMERKE